MQATAAIANMVTYHSHIATVICKKPMRITTAYAIQSKFIAGLQIVGEDEEGNLEWTGTTQQWQIAKDIESDLSFEPYKDYSIYNKIY